MIRAECESCHAPIVWTYTAHGKRMPMNAEPDDRGTHYIDPNGEAGPISIYVPVASRHLHEALYIAHFVTCPDADYWRRPR